MATRKVNDRPESRSTRRVHAGAWNFCFNHAKYEYMPTRKVNAYPESTCWGLGFFLSYLIRVHAYPESKCLPVE